MKINKTLIDISEERTRQIKHIGNKKPIIFIGMGTCGLASGAGDTYNTLLDELKKNNLDCEIISVGCIGACHDEPIFDIKLPGKSRLVYRKITKDKVAQIVAETINEGRTIPEFVMGQYLTKEQDESNWDNVPEISKIPFFEKQVKFVTEMCGVVDPLSLDEYIVYNHGYHSLIKVLEQYSPEEVIDIVKKSGLRGRGGGGFPTGQKWEFARQSKSIDGQKYLICNADEGDPGSFQNRSLLESLPFSEIEGMTIAGYAIGANKGYIYCRAEYPLAVENLQKSIKIAYEKGLLGKNILGSNFSFDIEIKMGAGAFVCGEETALIESIEGNRGMPRIKPPFPTTIGLFQRPTVINNVETLAQIPKIIYHGVEYFTKLGCKNNTGTKAFSLTGKISKSGLVEVPLGITVKEIIEIGGGPIEGHEFKAIQIGGPSGFCLPKKAIIDVNGKQTEIGLNTSIDYDTLKSIGGMMGSGGLVVMDSSTCMVDTARYFMDFIQEESCGKCVPCREGTKRMLETLKKLVNKPQNEMEAIDRLKSVIYLERLSQVIRDSALCGLGNSAPNPVLSTLKYFRQEYEEHLYDEHCSAKYCIGLLKYEINDKCVGCMVCKINCPNDAILGEKKQRHYIIQEKCIKCGLCKTNCKFNAVDLG